MKKQKMIILFAIIISFLLGFIIGHVYTLIMFKNIVFEFMINSGIKLDPELADRVVSAVMARMGMT